MKNTKRFLTMIVLTSMCLVAISCKSSAKKADTASDSSEKTDMSYVQPVINVVMEADDFESRINELIEAGGAFQLLDVRGPDEILTTGKIEGAYNLDWNDGRFLAEYGKLDKDLPTMVYCRSGVRSGKASALLMESGFTEVYDLDGGITEWIAQGKPVIKKQ